ncbi:Ger(x)C family spore germination protein [Cellulosilyticum sp. I15G10I2]|uniref:Ger(x)C family spore germination protein n=1 Tax=Cellulosilyticum sp. I15G10I2 TaxID=1892843 RepID=UPI00085BFE7D|nr:Ger(x)C family spore germination protein [Cellulosilyticum sp. I15G10I2]
MNKFKWLFLLIFPLVLTGCWDSVELDERHIILDIALDKNPDLDLSQPINEQQSYRITYGVPDIGLLSGKESLAEKVKTNITTNSVSITTSIDEVEKKTQDTVTLNHTKALIIGEELLKDKGLLRAAIDALLRDMKMGRSVTLLAVKGLAGDFARAENPQNPIIGMYVMEYYNNRERGASRAKEQLLGNFIKEIDDTGVATIPIISSNEEGIIHIRGAALIKDYELVTWLDEEEVRGELFVEGEVRRAPVVVDYENQYLTYMIKEQESKIAFKENNGSWECYINITTTGDIKEYVSTDDKNILNEQSISKITEILKQEIEKQVNVAVNKSKELEVDFLEIGLEMYRKHPKQWKNYKDTWDKGAYKNLPIHVSATVNIQNTGVLQ